MGAQSQDPLLLPRGISKESAPYGPNIDTSQCQLAWKCGLNSPTRMLAMSILIQRLETERALTSRTGRYTAMTQQQSPTSRSRATSRLHRRRTRQALRDQTGHPRADCRTRQTRPLPRQQPAASVCALIRVVSQSVRYFRGFKVEYLTFILSVLS